MITTELPVIHTNLVLRTPDECFARVPDFPYLPRYLEIGRAHV